mmetsp:Transcript_31100/g.75176  ORF Transcript_31100/g.75176 Transcript_31100/m.75176 type:complete len:223 (+) Transcript_31100:28-696(+)
MLGGGCLPIKKHIPLSVYLMICIYDTHHTQNCDCMHTIAYMLHTIFHLRVQSLSASLPLSLSYPTSRTLSHTHTPSHSKRLAKHQNSSLPLPSSSSLPPLNVEHQPRRIGNLVRHALQKRHPLPPVDQPVIVRERKVHHGPRHDIPLPVHDRPHLRGMHTQYSALGLIDNGSSHERAERAAVRDRECPPAHIVERERPILRLLAEEGDGTLDVREGHVLGIA